MGSVKDLVVLKKPSPGEAGTGRLTGDQIPELGDLNFDPSQRCAGLHIFPLLDRLL